MLGEDCSCDSIIVLLSDVMLIMVLMVFDGKVRNLLEAFHRAHKYFDK